jgi:two-component system, cell cycle response regulator
MATPELLSESCASAAAGPVQAAASPAPEDLVLIVDDDAMIAAMERRMLEKGGYACQVANDAESAWRLLSPDVSLVLLDVSMPGQNGPEVLRRMRRDPTLAGIPVIFATGRSDPATRIQCLTMGAVDFIEKPFSSKKLLETVRRALDQSPRDEISEDDERDPLEAALDIIPEAGADLSSVENSALPPAEIVRGLLIERRATRRALDGHRRVVSALFRLHQAITTDVPLKDLGASIVALSQKALRADRATLWLESGRSLQAIAHHLEESSTEIALSGSEAPARAWRESLTIEEGARNDGYVVLHSPLTVGAERIGVLSLSFPRGQRPSESLASFFCAEVALALDWARRLEQAKSDAMTDALTGVHNRRYLELRLGEEIRRARSVGSALSVLFVDIDHFKGFNDTFGHEAGDRLLRATAGRIAAGLRGDDLVARYGGDEFIVLLPGADRAGAALVASRMQADFAAITGEGRFAGSDVSFTIGGATFPDDADSPGKLLTLADEALLRGKRAGRDRYESFTEESLRVPAA